MGLWWDMNSLYFWANCTNSEGIQKLRWFVRSEQEIYGEIGPATLHRPRVDRPNGLWTLASEESSVTSLLISKHLKNMCTEMYLQNVAIKKDGSWHISYPQYSNEKKPSMIPTVLLIRCVGGIKRHHLDMWPLHFQCPATLFGRTRKDGATTKWSDPVGDRDQ